MSNSTNKSIADKEAASTHHVAEGSHPGHRRGEGEPDRRARELEREAKRNAKKK
ncbi:MAG TPA: hypothetical protein VFL80_02665 [Thermoanaerobaculia bacterium]|nr:hypothetical protein [Thermoanaerobaculia bacterium]